VQQHNYVGLKKKVPLVQKHMTVKLPLRLESGTRCVYFALRFIWYVSYENYQTSQMFRLTSHCCIWPQSLKSSSS